MKKNIAFTSLFAIILTSCNRVGVGVVVSGDTIVEGTSWLWDNIGTILLVFFVLVGIFLAIVFAGTVIENRESQKQAKLILNKETEKEAFLDEKQSWTQIAQTLAYDCIQNGTNSLKYNSIIINNVQEKLEFFIKLYKKEGRPRGISITMYSSLHCEKNADFHSWLFDSPTLKNVLPENLSKEHLILLNAFLIIADNSYNK